VLLKEAESKLNNANWTDSPSPVSIHIFSSLYALNESSKGLAEFKLANGFFKHYLELDFVQKGIQFASQKKTEKVKPAPNQDSPTANGSPGPRNLREGIFIKKATGIMYSP
jgi:hypothetical protein